MNRKLLALVCLPWAPLVSEAQSAEAGNLSLDQALSRGERTVPDLLSAEKRSREAAASRVGAGIRFPSNPRIQLDVRPALGKVAGRAVGYGLGIDIPFEVANAAGARLEEADRRIDVASSELRVSRLEARLLVFQSYVAVQLARVRVDQTRETKEIALRIQHVARERFNAGAGSEIETTSADVELVERRAQLHAAEAEHAVAERELRYLLDLPRDEPLRLTSAMDQAGPAPPVDMLAATAWAERPDLQVLQNRLALLQASDKRLRREAMPKVGLFGALDVSPDSSPMAIGGLSIELPFAQRNQGPLAIVAAARETEVALLELERRRTMHVIEATRLLYESRRTEIDLLRGEGIPAAERRLLLIETGWRMGRFEILRVTTAAQDLVRLRERQLAALGDLWHERIMLERLAGGWPGTANASPSTAGR